MGWAIPCADGWRHDADMGMGKRRVRGSRHGDWAGDADTAAASASDAATLHVRMFDGGEVLDRGEGACGVALFGAYDMALLGRRKIVRGLKGTVLTASVQVCMLVGVF